MKTAIVYHKELERYSFGEGHPLAGDRFKRFFNFFRQRFSSLKGQFAIIEPKLVTDEILALVHAQDYIKAIRTASEGVKRLDIYRYASSDNLNPLTGYIPQGIERGARLIVGASVLAGELVAEGKFPKAIAIGGGMHHAKPHFGEGFCFYNDVAVLVEMLKQKYNFKRILLLDTDAHAGNGTKEIFYEDPEVLFIDIHQDPSTLYPGSGFIQEIGKNKGEGFTINFPLLPGTGNQAYQYLFEEVIFALTAEFRPQIIIRYGGSDPHYLDPLTDLGMTQAGFRMIGQKVNALTKEFTQGKSIDLLLSGYNLEVLPFAWSSLIAGLLDLEIDLSDFKEESAPALDTHLAETKDMVSALKKYLKRYWRCMG